MINIHQSKAQDFPLITDPVRMFWPSQPMAKPAYLESIKDPDFDVEIIRITGDPGDSIPGIGGTWKDIARHDYSKKPVWNSDESLMYLKKCILKDRVCAPL